MPTATLECEAPGERDQAIQRAAEILRGGGVVVFPTETVYGVGASAASAAAIRRLREVKDRPDDKPFSVHMGEAGEVERYADLESSPLLRRLVRKTMPGPVTLVVQVPDEVIARKLRVLGLPPEAQPRLYHRNTIGLRCPDHDIGAAVLRAAGVPIVASSANRAGQAPPTDARQAAEAIGGEVDLILDGGPTRFAKASTVITLRGNKAQLLREGVVDDRYLKKLLQTTILFICPGNTCRSAMAEAIARDELSRRLGVAPEQLPESGVQVLSAGTFAHGGAPMTPEAAEALRRIGVPAQAHTARPLTFSMIQQAEAIFCMTDSHTWAVIDFAPSAAGKTHLLDPCGSPIDDPIGAGVQVYVQCASQMRDLIRRRLDELGLDATTGA